MAVKKHKPHLKMPTAQDYLDALKSNRNTFAEASDTEDPAEWDSAEATYEDNNQTILEAAYGHGVLKPHPRPHS
jgi:hypothetical protein